ncbi:MAG: aminoacyl-tRNA hydrolase [Anaerolineales bacterium]|jgi:PTH1 family peptidyl-tRNA hydrolase
MKPFLIAGLGNPGPAYKLNRHNIGFMVVDRLAKEWDLAFRRRRRKALVASGLVEDRKVILAKPQTFVNLSGRPVASLLRYYRIPLNQLLVIQDDLDLPLGALRLRPEGGSGGHKGLRSIQQTLGTQAYARLRMGIGRPPGSMDPADYVLSDFSRRDQTELALVLEQSIDCIHSYLRKGIEEAMTRCNALSGGQ